VDDGQRRASPDTAPIRWRVVQRLPRIGQAPVQNKRAAATCATAQRLPGTPKQKKNRKTVADTIEQSRLQALTASTLYVEYILDYALSQGCDLTTALIELGVTEEQLNNSGARIALTVEHALLMRGIAETGDNFFGLHMGEKIRPRFMGSLGYASMSSARLRDAITMMLPYQRVTTEFGTTSASEEQERYVIRWQDAPETQGLPGARHRVENYFAACITFGRWITGSQENPAEIRFMHAAPASTAEYDRVFRCPLYFSAGENSISLPMRVLDLRLRDADAEVNRVMAGRVQQELSSYNARGSLPDQVRHAIREDMLDSTPSIESVAERLHLKPWTLRRKLKVENLDFTSLLDDVRKEMAVDWLANSGRTVSDIAASLGYSEQSAFNRWFNATPLEYRDKHRK
jgi:AraC-like DNA-binding protein